MDSNNNALTRLKKLVSSAPTEELRNELLEIYLELKMPESATGGNKSIFLQPKSQPSEEDEIEKLNRRLPLWGQRKTQFNSLILQCYLRLSDTGKSVTVDSLRKQFVGENLGTESDFDRNFPQMKMISTKNHGQVFTVNRETGLVDIWWGAKDAVSVFRRVAGIVKGGE